MSWKGIMFSQPRSRGRRMRPLASRYDPALFTALEKTVTRAPEMTAKTVEISQLTDSMIIAEDVVTSEQVLLIAKGQETTLSARRHLQQYRANGLIGDQIHVLVAAQ